MLRFALPLLFGLAATPAFAQTQPPAPPPPPAQITVVGTATREVEPDRATLSVGVTTERTNPAEAMNENAKAAKAIVDAIEATGVERRDIRTSTLSLSPVYTQGSATTPSIIRSYRASNQVSVTLRKIDAVGALIGKLAEKGVTNISGPSFEVSSADKIIDELRAEAAKNARRKAEMLAAALDVKVGRVLDVRTGDAPVEMARPRMMAMKAAAAAPPVEGGTQTLGADVTVSFEIAP